MIRWFHPSFYDETIAKNRLFIPSFYPDFWFFFLPFSFPFPSQCDTCDSKKTTSLLEGARYAYARENHTKNFLFLLSSFLCSDLSLESVVAFTFETFLFARYGCQLLMLWKIICHFFAYFSLFRAISTHIHIGAC